MKNNNITGIIMAGGRSSRMKCEKGLVRFREKFLIEYPVNIFKEICSDIIISSNHNKFNFLDCKVFHDEIIDCGPIGGIYTCLKKSITDYNLIAACDMPFLNNELFNFILSNSVNQLVVVPTIDGKRLEPLCGFYHKNCVPVLYSLIQQKIYKMHEVLEALNPKIIRIKKSHKFYQDNLFHNINTKPEIKSSY